jgi:hypothetical protein
MKNSKSLASVNKHREMEGEKNKKKENTEKGMKMH